MEPKKESRIADDLLCGAGEIAEFLYGDPGRRRRIYHPAERGGLPVFRLGAVLHARKSVLADYIAQQEVPTGPKEA